MKDLITKILKEHDTPQDTDLKGYVQFIVDKVYPHIVTNLGPSKYREETPNIEVWNDIYARYSGIPEMRGEGSKTSKAEWKAEDNTIYVYYPNMVDTEDIIRSLLHEYSHSLQDPAYREENRKLGYDDDPGEIEAHQAEESWRDYLVYLKDNLQEQEESKESSEPNGFSPQLITYLKYIFVIYEPTNYYQFRDALYKQLGEQGLDNLTQILYLTLLYNCDVYSINNIKTLLNDIPSEKYKISALYNYYVEFNDAYDSWTEEEECVEEGSGEASGDRSGEPCECSEYEEISVIGPEEEDIEEFIDCTQATTEQLEKAGHDGDCECIVWESKEVEVYQYPITMEYLLSYVLIEDTEKIYDRVELNDELGDEEEGYIVIQSDTETADLEAETWDYFPDSEEDSIQQLSTEMEWGKDEIIEHITEMGKLLLPKPLTEQEEQMNLFPTGEWEFPVGWEEDDDYISEVKHNVPEHVFKKIMTMWDQDGIDFTIFKLLGVRPDSVINTYVLKRYIQNTTKPIPVSYTFDCNDLKELFDRNNSDYDLSYIPAYLCGDDSFWDHEDWYNYEWDEYMTDAINESNWKTISEIFGGVSQSVAEDILNKSSSSEEVDELIEKYEEEIDEIQNYIIWAYNDEHEYAIKNEMAKDIEDKLAEHFQHEGHLHTDNEGSKSWTIEGDLRDYVNDQWDNTDIFEYHTDHVSQPLEDMMLDFQVGNNLPYTIFSALIEEEYAFWEYCEGKQGECLRPETKWFDGYWHPDVDINESLSDRLSELTYETTVTTPEGETTPLHEQEIEWGEEERSDEDDGGEHIEPGGKFTPLDIRALNYIATTFTLEDLSSIATMDDTQFSTELYGRWGRTVKLFGETVNDNEDYGKSTRFAKWVLDNIQNAGNPEEDDTTIDFGRVTNPVKAWPSIYSVDGTEDGWEQVYRTGEIDIVAYSSDEAEERATDAWWEYEPDMETTDYGDYDSGDFEIGVARYHHILENKSVGPINEENPVEDRGEQPVPDETPFTHLDAKILNRLATIFDRPTLRNIWEEDESMLPESVYSKYENLMKLYGERGHTDLGFAKSTRFAKWADDNWDEAQRIQDMWSEQFEEEGEEDMGKELDFSKVTDPVKEWPHEYEVEATESYWAKEYRYGATMVAGYGEENAEHRADTAWWEWDVDMEYGDQGDTDDHNLEIETVTFMNTIKENKALRSIVESYTNHTLNLYEIITEKYKSQNIVSLVELRENIREYITHNALNKDILYIKEVDLISYLLNRGIIVEDTLEKPLIIEEPEINTAWWKTLPKKEKKYILEHGTIPMDDEPSQEIPEFIKKFLVVARFDSKGTWGVSPATFILYMRPNGQIMYIKKSSSLNNVPEQFRVGNSVTFGDLLNFENTSRYDLTMKGNIRETYLSTGRKQIDKHNIKITPQKQFYLKNLLKEMRDDTIDDLLRLAKTTKVGWQGGPGRLKVFEFLNKLRDSGLVNMFQATDFLHSGSNWLRKYIDLHQPDSLEPIDEDEDNESILYQKETIQYLIDNADSVRDVIISNVIAQAELKGDNSLEGASRLMRPAAMDMVKLWSGHFVK